MQRTGLYVNQNTKVKGDNGENFIDHVSLSNTIVKHCSNVTNRLRDPYRLAVHKIFSIFDQNISNFWPMLTWSDQQVP